MKTFEYHQFLKYIYFEGYADSYEGAENLIEELDNEEIDNLYEKFANESIEDFIFENVSGGRGKRAKSSRAPIPQRVTARQAREIRTNARQNPRPSPAKPSNDSLAAMRKRFEDAEKESKKQKPLPSRGIGASERVLRRRKKRTPGGTAQERVAELGRRLRQIGKKPFKWPEDENRMKRISAALKKRKQWGTPEAANEEYVINYLISEGYTDTLESAEIIIENMSEQWLYDILMEKPFQIYGPDPHGPSDSELRPLGKPYKNKKRARTRADKLDQEIGGYRHIVRRVPEN